MGAGGRTRVGGLARKSEAWLILAGAQHPHPPADRLASTGRAEAPGGRPSAGYAAVRPSVRPPLSVRLVVRRSAAA